MEAGEVAQVYVSSYSGEGSFELMVVLMPSPKEILLDEPVSENLSMGGLDRYTYSGFPDQMIRVQLGSSEFDTILRVLTPTGFQLESDDASVTGQEQRWTYLSQIEYRFVEAGTISIEVVGYDSEDEGVYELVVSEGDTSQITEYDPEQLLQPGESITSYLPEDAVVVDSDEGRIGHHYSISLMAGKTYELNLMSSSFDAYLEVSGPAGGYWENDDGPSGLNSQLVFTAPVSGQYQVLVTSLAGDSLGLYTLTTAAIELGSLILDTEGSLNSNRVEQEFNVSVTSAADLRIDLQSEAFDTRLSLLDPQGIIIAEDDDGGSDSNSLITHSIEEPGIYTIRVMSFGQEGSGPFRLQVFSKLR
jgi:hypothetical protein